MMRSFALGVFLLTTLAPAAGLAAPEGRARDKAFNRHLIGARGGMVVIPTWILQPFLATHANALCRGGNIGGFAADRGLLRQDGCNFYVGGEYTYRRSRLFDISAAMGYQKIHTPDGYWLDDSEWKKGCTTNNPQAGCDLGAADYTKVDLHMMFMQADFIARYPIVVTDDLEFGIGGGGGFGLGVLFGGVWQTSLGNAPGGRGPNGVTPNSCQRIEDLADFTRCTPAYRPEEDVDVNGQATPPAATDFSRPESYPFASCDKDSCSDQDLAAFGYRREQDKIPPVIPIVNLVASARLIVKDVWGISLNGGWNTGFYFGGGMTYHFGKRAPRGSEVSVKPAFGRASRI